MLGQCTYEKGQSANFPIKIVSSCPERTCNSKAGDKCTIAAPPCFISQAIIKPHYLFLLKPVCISMQKFAVCSTFRHAESSREQRCLLFYVISLTKNAVLQHYYQAVMMAQMKGGVIYRLLLKYQKEN